MATFTNSICISRLPSLSLILTIYINSVIADMTPATNAFWIWAGFVMPTLAGSALWSARPRKDAWKIFFITSGYQFLLFMIFASIIKAWM
ncbi:MAG: DUF1761 domain-containing protein [Candidatus Paceibacterota bacterium]